MTAHRMTTPARLLALALAFTIALPAGCKSKDEGKDKGGGGKPPAGSGSAPAATTDAAPIGPVGGGAKVESKGATLELPPGVDPAKITIEVRPVKPADLPAPLATHRPAIERNFETLRVIEGKPDGPLGGAGVLSVTIAASELPAGRKLGDVVAVGVAADGTIEDLRIVGVDGDQVRIEVKHFSWLLVAVAMSAIALTGTLALIMRGASEPIMRRDCATWLEPDDGAIAALAANDSSFSFDTASGEVKLSSTLKGKDVDQGAHLLKAGQILDRGVGDCVNMSTVFGSLLLAKKNPVRLVAGTATYRRKGKTYQGFHQWAETVIDGKAYYVDTFEPSQTKLIPLAEAGAELKLERNRMCGKNPDGTAVGPMPYDPAWVDPFVSKTTEALEKELELLKEQHRDLAGRCAKATDPTSAICDERKKVYDRAKGIQDELNKRAGQ